MITLSPFLKIHKQHLHNLSKSQAIDQVLIGIDMHAHETLRLESFLESSEYALGFTENLLKETEDALRRCRNLLASEKELTSRLVNIIKEHEGTKGQVEIFNKN